MVSKRNHPQMGLIQVSELLYFTHIYIYTYVCIYIYIHIHDIANTMEIFHVDIFGMNLFMARFAVEGSGMEIN